MTFFRRDRDPLRFPIDVSPPPLSRKEPNRLRVRYCESLGLAGFGTLTGLVLNLKVNLCCGAVLGYLLAIQFHF